MTVRIIYWNPNKFDETFENVIMERLIEAAEVIKEKAKYYCPIGTIKRLAPPEGPIWKSRDPGRLRASIRVVRKKRKGGKAFSQRRNIRIYAGHFTAYYPYWVEFGSSPYGKRIPAQPFMRPAFYSSLSEIKAIIGVK